MDKAGFEEMLAAGYTAVPVVREILADMETPVSCYHKLPEACFLLESVEGGEKLGRYSIVGGQPAGILTVTKAVPHLSARWPEIQGQGLPPVGDPFQVLEWALATWRSPPPQSCEFATGLVGALAYDAVRHLEPSVALLVEEELPEAAFFLAGDYVVFDHLKRTVLLVTNVYAGGTYEAALARLDRLHEILSSPAPYPEWNRVLRPIDSKRPETLEQWSSSFERSDFEAVVADIRERILAGDAFQVVPSQRLSRELPGVPEPLRLYRLLRHLNPSPYSFLLSFESFSLVGCSPELMVRVDGDGSTTLRPIAGTYRRTGDEARDRELAEALRQDPKERAEHLMLVDLARNDLGRVAVPGTVQPQELMVVEKYSHVLHLVSSVTCNLRPGMTPVDALRATFPAGTLSGAPKVSAMRIIAHHEPVARGFYAGCMGVWGFDGTLNTAMTIRSVLLRGREVRLQVGCGIVADSEPAREYQETINKAAAILRAVEEIA